jgi:hypothetical protein
MNSTNAVDVSIQAVSAPEMVSAIAGALIKAGNRNVVNPNEVLIAFTHMRVVTLIKKN